jgi:hypothetical protein
MNEDLLRCLMQIIGRATIPQQEVRAVVGRHKSRVRAFNLLDGTVTLRDVARKTRIDRGNLSRSAANWVENGIAFWIGQGKDARLLHLYPIPEKESRRAK